MLAAYLPDLVNSRATHIWRSRASRGSPVPRVPALLAACLRMRGLGSRIGLDVPERYAEHDFAHE